MMVDSSGQSALRFLWWMDGDPGNPIKTYQLTVHTFGLTSLPSVAGYALRRTVEENRCNASQTAVSTTKRHLYVDDMLTSVQTVNQAADLVTELNKLLARGGFEMAKYASNQIEVLDGIPINSLAPPLQELDLHNEVVPAHKTLGSTWHSETERTCFKVSITEHCRTRRCLLSVLASIYDSLGMVGPYTLPAKIILLELTRQESG